MLIVSHYGQQKPWKLSSIQVHKQNTTPLQTPMLNIRTVVMVTSIQVACHFWTLERKMLVSRGKLRHYSVKITSVVKVLLKGLSFEPNFIFKTTLDHKWLAFEQTTGFFFAEISTVSKSYLNLTTVCWGNK